MGVGGGDAPVRRNKWYRSLLRHGVMHCTRWHWIPTDIVCSLSFKNSVTEIFENKLFTQNCRWILPEDDIFDFSSYCCQKRQNQKFSVKFCEGTVYRKLS